ncbi:retrovirus-related Pol polyprotein from transposon TNT 1-94 isoform X1 [Cinnamomum micranthum f. kanehirae]|uniref:Retrovirus-related Pol polyprotein from transposon TNT 1-94 isoform X1 n=1 Tax=Cinnamomum micranthum f. kanehirae TaxID=337451 RepID=A0A443NYE9_9MAGN|nr:retrovirus-related Pol polyprotein from transposon TNT 1-94 isoform X1 [Cinnamomum micranthum f. kanehirae]
MIVNACSALGLSGNTTKLDTTWYLDSGASNHMRNSSKHLSKLQPYDGNLRISTADGGSIPITAIGEISHPLPLNHVFLSPQLSTNLLFVGQLVDHNCYLSFFSFGLCGAGSSIGEERTKLSAQSSKCAFLGYANDHEGFLCYDPKVKRVRVSRNVVFFENQYFSQHHHDNDPSPLISLVPNFAETSISPVDKTKPILVYERRRRENTTVPKPPDNIISSISDPAPTPDISQSVQLRRFSRISRPSDRFGFTHTSLLTTLSSVQIPNHFSPAVQHECWRNAMQEELEALDGNHTWDIVQFPPSVKPIGCKWVYSIKLNPDGPWLVIKLAWWHSATVKNMALITMRHLLRLPK